jgi:hypothetical protein
MSKKIMMVAVMIGLVSVLALPFVASAQTLGIDEGDFANSGLSTASLPETVGNLIGAALGLLGLVALIIILIGGFKWMTAMGNEENAKKARALITQGVIGLIIIVCSYAITQFVLSALNEAAGN